jgi:hypothetical protein
MKQLTHHDPDDHSAHNEFLSERVAHQIEWGDTPTPRTDAEHAQFPMGGFTLDFARTLERELTTAQAELLKSCMRERLANEDCKYQKNRADDAGFMLIEANEQRDMLDDQLDSILLRLGRTQERMFNAEMQRDRLADLVKQFIKILDITEESDSGRLFHPTNITSCRAGDLQKIGELVEALRRASRTTNPEPNE